MRTVPRKLEANVLAHVLQFGSQIDRDGKGSISVTGARSVSMPLMAPGEKGVLWPDMWVAKGLRTRPDVSLSHSL